MANTMFAVEFKVGNITYSAESASALTATVEKGTGDIINIPETVSYGSKTFTVTSMSNCAFVDGNLKELYIPASLTNIRYDDSGGLLHSNRFLKKIIVDEDNTAYCDISGVMFTKNMKTLIAYPPAHDSDSHYEVPDGIEIIGKTAFDCSQNLRTITLPQSLRSIGILAFNASGIETINIPKSVDYLGDLCIRKINRLPFHLKSIYVNWENPISLSTEDVFSQDIYTEVTLYVPQGTKAFYESAPIWNNFFSIKEYDSSNINDISLDPDQDSQYFDLNGIATNNRNGIIIKVDKRGKTKEIIVRQ